MQPLTSYIVEVTPLSNHYCLTNTDMAYLQLII